MKARLKRFCVEMFRSFASFLAIVAYMIFLRWLLLVGHPAAQVIAVLLMLGLVVALAAGMVLLAVACIKRRKEKRNTKPRAGDGDQSAAAG